MSSFKLILDIGMEFVPGRFGNVLSAGIGTYPIQMQPPPPHTHTGVHDDDFWLVWAHTR